MSSPMLNDCWQLHAPAAAEGATDLIEAARCAHVRNTARGSLCRRMSVRPRPLRSERLGAHACGCLPASTTPTYQRAMADYPLPRRSTPFRVLGIEGSANKVGVGIIEFPPGGAPSVI